MLRQTAGLLFLAARTACVRSAQINIQAGGQIVIESGAASGVSSSTVADHEARIAALEAEIRQLRRDAGVAPPDPPVAPPATPLPVPPPSPPSPSPPPRSPVVLVEFTSGNGPRITTPGEVCHVGGTGWGNAAHSASLIAGAPGGISFTMPFAGDDVRIGLSSPSNRANPSFTSTTYPVYFRGVDSGVNGDVYVDSGVSSGVQYGGGSSGHLLGAGQDWFSGAWASATWSFRVRSANRVDFLADDTLLYSWTGTVSFPLHVTAWIYQGVSGCNNGPRNIRWL